ncbi:MAG: peptidylprolyl isomerase [Deltaproteobacteria bacterium]|jgi:peptidyl-prolyl cis-trans isomerase C
MNRVFRTFALFALLAFSVTGVGEGVEAEEDKASKGIAAVVNGAVIKQEEVDRRMDAYERHLFLDGKIIPPERVLEVKRRILETLIDEELLYQESESKKIEVEQSAIDEEIRRWREQFSSDEEFKKGMADMSLTEEDLKSYIRRMLGVRKLLDEEIVTKVKISEDEVRLFYDTHPDLFQQKEEVKASHILIKAATNIDDSEKKEARQKLKRIRERLEQGEDFAALAKEFSQCPSAARGGDLGYFSKGKMVKAFEEAAFALKVGELSGIVETEFGFHLIKVTDKKSEGMKTYDESKDNIRKYLLGTTVRRERSLYLEELKSKAKVERFLEEEGS